MTALVVVVSVVVVVAFLLLGAGVRQVHLQ
jgi:hypothetical protein